MKVVRSKPGIPYKLQGRTVSRIAMAIALLLILFLGSNKLATIGWADGGTTVSIDPALQSVSLGGTATTEVLVAGVTDLNCVEFDITFNPMIVEVVDADPDTEGVQIQPGDFLSPDWPLDNTVDNASGTIACVFCEFGGSASGSGPLATITWRGKAVGTSFIHFDYILLSALGGVPIYPDTEDGEITVTASIGDYVWVDENGSGIQDSIYDVGINDVDMELWEDTDASGTFSETMDTRVMTTTTKTNLGNDGWYLFTGLGAGTYFVRIAPAAFDSGGALWSYGPTEPNVGSDDTVDSDGDNPTCPYSIKTGSCGEIGFENNILATTTLTDTGGTVSDDLDVDFGVVAQAPPTAITLSSFTAKSSGAGLEAPSIWPWLVGAAVLTMGGVLWIKRRR